MRLIDTYTLQLKQFSADPPPYAILSHTWGPDGSEVLFEEMNPDLSSSPVASKASYQKIKKTCEIARDVYGLDWAWIDTCCIDKKSSAELSEAINSMFRYYQDAAICFAFLEDMEGDNWAEFYQARWFKRGWTLQELIAPEKLLFFDKFWECCGSRQEWEDAIEVVTGIIPDVFDKRLALADIPVATRMHWASKRVTTREEDMAYCLMGIFDVNMPMLYGEGKKAFIRLQEEIIKQTPDLSIFGWRAPNVDASVHIGVLATSPSYFLDSDMKASPSHNETDSLDFADTNQGIRFHSGLHQEFTYDSECLSLSLNHTLYGERCAIFLRRVSPNTYVRIQPYLNVNINGDSTSRKVLENQTFHVIKKLRVAHEHILNTRRVFFPADFAAIGFQLYAVEPPGAWSPINHCLYAGYGGSFRGHLRFRDAGGNKNMDELVLLCYYMHISTIETSAWFFKLVSSTTFESNRRFLTLNLQDKGLRILKTEKCSLTIRINDAFGVEQSLRSVELSRKTQPKVQGEDEIVLHFEGTEVSNSTSGNHDEVITRNDLIKDMHDNDWCFYDLDMRFDDTLWELFPLHGPLRLDPRI